MSPRPPDQALRRTVAELATAAPDDVEAVLAGLDLPQRRQVQALLADYLGHPPEILVAPTPVPAATSVSKVEGLSPWLAARVEGDQQGEGFSMTPVAVETLRACAAALEPEAVVEAPVPAVSEQGWLAKLMRREAVR
jgi:hypothetical protein